MDVKWGFIFWWHSIVTFMWISKWFFLGSSGAEFVRKEVPLYVQPASTLLNLDSPLASFADLQRVLYDEERSAYNQAIEQNMRWCYDTMPFFLINCFLTIFSCFKCLNPTFLILFLLFLLGVGLCILSRTFTTHQHTRPPCVNWWSIGEEEPSLSWHLQGWYGLLLNSNRIYCNFAA